MLKPGELDRRKARIAWIPNFMLAHVSQVPNFGTAGEEGRKHGKGNGSVG